MAGWWNPLIRTASVSAKAKYVWGLKSSAWFDGRVDEKRDVDVCRAWDDQGRLRAADFR
jgi:hypothetical protein